jgi:hypothetical protein
MGALVRLAHLLTAPRWRAEGGGAEAIRMRAAWMTVLVLLAGPAMGQGLQLPPGLGGGGSGGGGTSRSLPGGTQGMIPGLGQPETPEQKRAFCQRVAQAAMRCGLGLDVTALSACLIRTLPPQDSMRVAQVANSARGNAGSLLTECGIGFGR